MSALGLLQLALLATLLLGFTTSALTALFYPLARERLRLWAPERRAKAGFLWIASPGIIATALTLLCLAPSLVAALTGGFGDHCLSHGDGHVHLCLLHPPTTAGGAVGWSILLASLLLLAARPARHLVSLLRARRALKTVLSAAEADEGRAVSWVPGDTPLALTLGVVTPQILIASTLRDALSPELLDGVVAHEHAHVRRQDVRLRVVASFFAFFHFSGARRALLNDLRLACEQAADAEAARTLEDPLCVAEAILAVERLASTSRLGGAFACGFGDNDVTARIEALLNPVAEETRLHLRAWLTSAAIVAVLAAEPLHHAVETLLTPVAR